MKHQKTTEEYVRQFHAHEDAAHEERDGDADERDAEQENAIEFGRRWFVGLIE